MWIKHGVTGNVVLVLSQDHIARLLSEGGVEVPDPTIKPEISLEVGIQEVVTETPVDIGKARIRRRKQG
jgi:hypothetical protein